MCSSDLTNVRTVLLAAVIGIVAFAGFQQALSNGLMKGGVPAQAAAAAAAEIRGGVSSADFALTLQDPNDPLRRALSEEATTMEDAQFAALRLTALIMTIGGGLGAGMLGISIRRSSAASARRRTVSET